MVGRVDNLPHDLGYELAQRREYSETTAARIDEDVQRLLNDQHEADYRLLSNARDRLDRLAEALLHEGTVEQDDLARILGPRVERTVEQVNA